MGLMSEKPIIAITMGDPAGVGPEVCLKAMLDRSVLEACIPVIFGDGPILERCADELGIVRQAPICKASRSGPTPSALPLTERPKEPLILDLEVLKPDHFVPAQVDAHTGMASYQFIQRAIDAALGGMVDAVTTAPINKKALSLAGIPYPGHTEMFAARSASESWCMMQYSEAITCTFATVHIGYAEVPSHLNTQRILEVIRLSADGLQRIRGRQPRIVVCGLNPHAGENGLFGNQEEENIIEPAILAARAEGYQVEGPIPPDTAFLPQKRQDCDVYVCMYHDQGHIPVKALAFDTAVNTTLGLPIIRTSVDHGTALDIAWKGLARESSLISAIQLAAKLARKDPSGAY